MNAIIEQPTKIKRNQRFSDQEIDIHAIKVSSNRDDTGMIESSNSTLKL